LKRDEEAKLPSDFNIDLYVRTFKMLDPPTVVGITPSTPDKEVIFKVNTAFVDYVKQLERIDMAKKTGPSEWHISHYAKQILVNMNILPITIHSGAKIVFTDKLGGSL
jgi:hypothetical protein